MLHKIPTCVHIAGVLLNILAKYVGWIIIITLENTWWPFLQWSNSSDGWWTIVVLLCRWSTQNKCHPMYCSLTTKWVMMRELHYLTLGSWDELKRWFRQKSFKLCNRKSFQESIILSVWRWWWCSNQVFVWYKSGSSEMLTISFLSMFGPLKCLLRRLNLIRRASRGQS